MAARIVSAGTVPPELVVVSTPRAGARAALSAELGVHTTSDNAAAVAGAATIVVAVTPQVLPIVMRDLRGQLYPQQLVVSIVAGVSLELLADGLRHAALVRAMPSILARVGWSLTVWMSRYEVTAAQRDHARAIFLACGDELEVEHEQYLDMVTAVSGSGPAWILLLLEVLIDAGVHVGLTRELARRLALHTMAGTMELVGASGLHPAELRQSVTTPAGTTAAGLAAMEEGRLRATIVSGVAAAYERFLAGSKRSATDEGSHR